MSGEIGSISRYTAAGVSDRIGLELSDEFERRAVGFVYNFLSKELAPPTASKLETCRIAAAATQHEVSDRLVRAFRFKDNFFLGEKINEKALMLAAICDCYVNHINEPAQDKDGNVIAQDNGFDDDVVNEAVVIWEEAMDLSKTGLTEAPPREESVFLAHIMAFDVLDDIERDAEADPEFADLDEILETDLKPIYAIARRATFIGDDLWHYAEIVERRVRSLLSPPTPPPRPGLRLVYEAGKPVP